MAAKDTAESEKKSNDKATAVNLNRYPSHYPPQRFRMFVFNTGIDSW